MSCYIPPINPPTLNTPLRIGAAKEGSGEEHMRQSVPATGDTEALRSLLIAEAIASIGYPLKAGHLYTTTVSGF